MIRFITSVMFMLIGMGVALFAVEVRGDTKISYRRYSLIPFAFGIFFFVFSFFRVVDPGNVGVPVTFGSVGSNLQPGIAITNPLATVKQMSIRTEEYTMSVAPKEGDKEGDDSVEVKGRDGATGNVDATILYRLDSSEVGSVYKKLGTNYVDKLIRPSSRTCIRYAYADVPMVEAATTARAKITDAITTCLREKIEPRGFILEDFQLRNVSVEKAVQDAINAKVAAQQSVEKKSFELQSALAEAEKKRIEAKGVADAQQIIKCGATIEKVTDEATGKVTEVAEPKEGASCEDRLTPAYLQYQYIQAMTSLAGSPNTTFFITPFDDSIVPMINIEKGGK